MNGTREEVFVLLDAVRAADDDRVRRQAIARLGAMRARREDRLVSVSSRTDGVRPTRRSRVGEVRSRLDALGMPSGSRSPFDPRIALYARRLVLSDRIALDALVLRLGRAELSLLCRDLDDASARRLLTRLGGERSGLEREATLIPSPNAGLLHLGCRRLAAAGALQRMDAGLVRYAGSSLAAQLLAFAEPDVAAAICRRIDVLARCESGVEASVLGWTECFGRFVEEVERS